MSQTPFNPGKFEKVEQVDLVPAMQENYDRINEDLRVAYQGMRENDKRRIQAAKRQGEALVSLSQFSQKLTDFLVERQKEKNEEDELAGLELAYAEGLDPLTMQKFDEDEAEVERVDGEIRRTAGAVEAEGNAFAGQRIRELSGHKALGYAKGVASNAAINYPIWFAQEAETATITIGNKQVTLASADSIEERMAVMAAIRRKFLVQFNNVNPALLNKYLFEPMRRFEATENKAWGQQFAERLQKERQAEAEDEVYANIKSGMPPGEIAMGFIDRFQGDYGSRGDARNKFFEILKELQQNGHIKSNLIDELAKHEFYHDGLKKVVAFGDPRAFGRQIEELRRQFEDTETEEVERRERQERARRTEFQNDFENAVAEAHSRGARLTDDRLDELASQFISGGLGTEMPQYMKDYETREEYDVSQEVEKYKAIARANGGYLTREQLKYASSKAYFQLKQLIAESGDDAKQNVADARAFFTARIKREKKMMDGVGDLTDEGQLALQASMGEYTYYYQQARAADKNHIEAHLEAQEKVGEQLLNGEIQEKVKLPVVYNKPRTQFVQEQRALNEKGQPVTGGLNGQTQEDLIAATLDYARGRGRIPSIYTEMANNSDKLDYEIAEENYRMLTGKELFAPQEIDLQTRALLIGPSSSSKSNRILIQNQQWGLDQIASVESEAYGGYTAFNQGGSNNGYKAHNPGDSAKGDHGHDRPITELTIREVMERQQRPNSAGGLFAAGRYQFIPTTLKETFPDTGLSLDDKFDAAAQDRFALARARWRLNLENSNQGLINEWRGLKFLSTAELTRLRAVLNNIPQSPYNQPENLRPGVAQALLR